MFLDQANSVLRIVEDKTHYFHQTFTEQVLE